MEQDLIGVRMTTLIECDKCKKKMFADSRSERGAYCVLSIDYTDGLSTYHLCNTCHRQLLTEFMRVMTPEHYDEYFGDWDSNE